MRNFIHCPGCNTVRPRTRHHVHPVFHFGRKNNALIIHLCQKCHGTIHDVINKHEKRRGGKLNKNEYVKIVFNFLNLRNARGKS